MSHHVKSKRFKLRPGVPSQIPHSLTEHRVCCEIRIPAFRERLSDRQSRLCVGTDQMFGFRGGASQRLRCACSAQSVESDSLTAALADQLTLSV